MTNFDYYKKEKDFESFIEIAIVAEKSYAMDPGTCILNCRRAVEMAIKWMYSVDVDLAMPYKDTLSALMYNGTFRSIVDEDIWNRINFVRKRGNEVAHNSKKLSKNTACLCLRNLFLFVDFLYYCYADTYEERTFDESLLQDQYHGIIDASFKDVDLKKLIEENKTLKEELGKRRTNKEPYVSNPMGLSEYQTRKMYIDELLRDVGWVENKNWINEVEVQGMPNTSGVGYADYVLYDDMHIPLAVIEAKKTCEDVSKGRQQAMLYANLLEKQYHRKPVIFLTNGFETRMIDHQYPERKVSSIYSKRDLEKYFNLLNHRTHLKYININKDIAGRYYQEEAIKAVCEAFDQKNKRKALLVMATGSGKTRTVIGLVDVLLSEGWVKNILFLADRNSLVTQAKRAFVNMLPDLSASNIVEDKKNYNAHAIFSTYQTMSNCIDAIEEDGQKLFTCGHFDLIICDEAHRSIYNKYKDIFNYFDAPLVGLTATPKDEIDKNTYELFDLENGVPTYGYELAQAVKDEYLVDFVSIESELNIVSNGISWDELTDKEKEEYEETFTDEDGNLPNHIDSSAINSHVFNRDTICKVLRILFEHGIKVEYGRKIGKTIIFAKNHKHAEKIYEIFNQEYPHLNGYARVIDNQTKFAQTLIDDFSDSKKLPQIAISVDMMDTGIDVPEVVNLVFFKKVMSKAKFWQMIGRGTRLCPGLLDGKDKKEFYIFDFCGNFEFFRIYKGKPSANTISIQSAIFNLKFEIVYKLQDLIYQTDALKKWRTSLVEELVEKVKELDRNRFDVRQHIQYVDTYSHIEQYNDLTYEDCLTIKEELSPLVKPDADEINAVRFDGLMYGIELAYLAQKKYPKAYKDLLRKVKAVSGVANIPAIQVQSELIYKILNTDYVKWADISDFEQIRENLRDLMKYIPTGRRIYETNFEEDVLSTTWHESNLESEDLQNYKDKIEYYIKQHQEDYPVIAKLKENKPMNANDIKELESILWDQLGTKQEYYSEYGEKPLGEFVREIVGLDMNAAKEAFSKYLDEKEMNRNQIYFVNQIVEFIVRNGVLKDVSVLQDSPFTDKGTVYELFGHQQNVWNGIQNVINDINKNALYGF